MTVLVDPRGIVVPLAILLVSEAAIRLTGYHSDSLAAPSQVFVAGAAAIADGSLGYATVQTLLSAIAGLAIGFSLGLLLGILLGLLEILDHLLEVTIEIVRPVPSVALIPIALLIFGFGYRMEIVTVAFATIWPTLILARSAISGIEPRLLEVSRAVGLPLYSEIAKIIVPAALPRIFIALRLSTGIALIVAVTVEVSTNTIGLGCAMMDAARSLHPDLTLALLCWIGFLGWAFNWAMTWVQRSFLTRFFMEQAP
jgi:ABC-type nitrate/sulfonate/bicarbonate transport system permease component